MTLTYRTVMVDGLKVFYRTAGDVKKPAVLLLQPSEQIHRIIVGLVLGEPHIREAHHRFHAGGVIAVQRNHPTLQKFFAALLIFAANRGERNAVRFNHMHGVSFQLLSEKDGATC